MGFSPTALPTFLTALALVAVGISVRLREPYSAVSRTFTWVIATVTTWLVAMSLLYCSNSEEVAYVWARAAYIGICLIPAAVYNFTVSLLQLLPQKQEKVKAAWTGGAVFAALMAGTPFFVTGVYQYRWGYYPRLGPLSLTFLTYFSVVLGSSLALYIREYRRPASSTLQKHRIGSFLTAFAIGYVGSIDYLPSFGVDVYPFGYVPIFIFLVLSARASWKYHLVDFTPSFAAEQILETMHGAVLVADSERRIRVANQGAAELLRTTVDDLIGSSMHEVAAVPEPNPSDTLARGGTIRDRATQWRARDGVLIDVALSASPLRDAKGAPVGTVHVAIDITDLKRAEKSILKLSRRNELILNSAGEGIYGVDREGKTSFVNPAAARMLGRRGRDLTGISEHDILHPKRPDGSSYPPHDCPILGSIRDGSINRITDEVFFRRDGTSFPVEYISTPIVEEGIVQGAVITFRDVTDRKLSEQQRIAMIRAEEANKAKDEFLATVSHELRSPMTAILGWLQLLKSETPDAETLRLAIGSIDRSAKMQSQLIEDLLDVARITSGKLPLHFEPFDLASVLEELVGVVMPITQQKRIELIFHRSASPVIRGDARRIRQVVWNLLTNAIKFTQSQGRITLKLDADGDTAAITVADTGSGIPPDFLPYVFDRYRQAGKPEDGERGLGLGLAIAKWLVEMHKGKIVAESEGIGRGARFTVTLPVLDESEVRESQTAEARAE